MAVDTSELRAQVATRGPAKAGKTIKQAVVEQLPQIARALPRATGMTPERFTRLVMTEISRNPKLQECTVESFLGAMMYAAQMGIEPGPLGHAYLVPFGKTVTLIIGYRGLIELARRSGDIQSIEARAVHANDEFEWSYGLEDKLVHRPALDDRGDAVRYYGIARFKDGGHYFLVMSKGEVEKRRSRSRAKNDGPWVSDYEAMALKSVIRAMQPYLPLTPEAATAIEVDERMTATFDPDAEQPLELVEMPYEDVPDGGVETPPAIEGATGPGSDVPLPAPSDPGSEPLEEVVEVTDVDELSGTEVVLPEVLDSYDGMTAGQLAQECIKRSLANTGTKAALIERLRGDDSRPL